MRVSIVVPMYNALSFGKACIESIYAAKTSLPYEVIVVDNGSAEDVQAWLREESGRRSNFRSLRFEEPLGFPRAVNQGAAQARYELLVLLNSDTVVYDRWLDLLAAGLERDRPIVGPVTNHAGHDLQADPAAPAFDVEAGAGYAAGIHHRDVVNEPQRLVFFCVMMQRSVWSELGGLDEAYGPGNYEDDDFCLRARLAGYRLAIARNVFVFHHERRSFNANRLDHAELLARNQVLFCERAAAWSRKPAHPQGRGRQARPEIHDVAVIVASPRGSTQELRDSLASLANQTVAGFEVLVLAQEDLDPADFPQAPKFDTMVRPGGLAALFNAGIAATRGKRVAFLPAGDIYFPFHLEVLANRSSAAVYSAWCVATGDGHGAVRLDQAEPERLAAGDWAPLVCWMHSAPPLLDESLETFCGWDWVLRLRGRPEYVRRVTCEKTARPGSAAEAERVIATHPAADRACEGDRQRFVNATRGGIWERRLIVTGNLMERRARQMLERQKLRERQAALAEAETRLLNSADVASVVERPAVLLFSIIRWTDLTQRPHHFARGLARRGVPVFWIDVQLKAPEQLHRENLSIEIEPNLRYVELAGTAADVYQLEWDGGVLDAMTAAFATLGMKEATQLVNFPKWTPLVLRLRERFGWPIVYDCLDDQQAFGSLHPGNAPEFEPQLIRESGAMTVSGRSLYARHQPGRPDVMLLPNAVDFDVFAHARSSGKLNHLPHPIVGFFGAFSDWLDLDWIAESARRFPRWSFVYIGREGFASSETAKQWRRATSAPNIRVIGQVDQSTLAEYLAEFDVCTMPFRNLAITRSMNAVKIFEYLAAGKPVVVPDLPETRPLAELGLIAVYPSHEDSFRLLREAAIAKTDASLVLRRRRFAAENTWNLRVDDLAGVLNRRRHTGPPTDTASTQSVSD